MPEGRLFIQRISVCWEATLGAATAATRLLATPGFLKRVGVALAEFSTKGGNPHPLPLLDQ